jgi:hypothetical protein
VIFFTKLDSGNTASNDMKSNIIHEDKHLPNDKIHLEKPDGPSES